ncbi:MAG: hypothetical protein AAFR11_13450 [Pseudomonadota bacterium]
MNGETPAALRICVSEPDTKVVNIDGPNGNQNPTTDMSAHACEHASLPAVTLPF